MVLALWAALWAPGVARPSSSREIAPDPKSPIVEAALKRLAAKTAARRRLVASKLVAPPVETSTPSLSSDQGSPSSTTPTSLRREAVGVAPDLNSTNQEWSRATQVDPSDATSAEPAVKSDATSRKSQQTEDEWSRATQVDPSDTTESGGGLVFAPVNGTDWGDPANWKTSPDWQSPKLKPVNGTRKRSAKATNYTTPKSYWKDPRNWHKGEADEDPANDPWRDLKRSLKDRFGIGEGEGPWNKGGLKFKRSMGRGININPWSLHRLTPEDYIGLAKRGVGHVRLGGNIAEPLQDWTTCPASTKTLRHLGGNDSMARYAIINSLGKDPTPMGKAGFKMLKQAAADAVAAGLKVVLNPFHRRLRVAVSSDTIRWIWGAVLQEFHPDDFPYDQVAFEMVRLPISYVQTQYSNVEGQFQTMIQEWVVQVRAKQPDRVVIMTAVQTVTDDTMHVSSYEALMRYSSILSKQALSALSAAPVMISFEVSPWTANDRDDETDDTMGMAYGGYSCSNDQTFCKSEFYMKNETEKASNMVKTHLLRLSDAYPEVPVYLASYGMPTGADNRDQWLRTIREGAEKAHYGTAVYDFIGSQSSLICADTYKERMREFDSSSEIAAVFNLSFSGSNATLPPCTRIKALSNFKRIPRTGCVCSMDERSRPLWAYPYFVPKSVAPQVLSAAPVKKGLNDTKDLHLGDLEYPGFEYFGTYEAKLVDVGDEHKNFGAAPFPLGEAFSITMPQFEPRVRASAAALGLKVNIVEPVMKTILNVSEQSTLDLFPPGVTDHLTFGEMAITLSHRKAWQACIDSNLPACLIFEDDFTAVGPELRRRLDTAVALLPHDWQFLQLGRCWDVTCDVAAARVSPDADLFRADGAQMGTCFHAYAMTRKGAFELQKVAKFLDVPVDHAGTYLPERNKRFYISPAIFTQNPALRLVDSTSMATQADMARGAATVDNTFRPALVPECATSDPRRLAMSAIVPGLRATGAALAMQSTQILWHVRTGIEHKVPACLNLINKSKAYLVLDRAWVPDLTLDFDYYGCVMQYAGKVWMETDADDALADDGPNEAKNRGRRKKKLLDETIGLKVACLTNDCTPSATLLPRCPIRTTRHAGLEAWERLGGILKLAQYSSDMPDSTRQTEIATALTDGVEELPVSQYARNDWDPMSEEDVEEEKSADAAAEKRKPAEQSLADALKDDMQADEEKQKLTSDKLKGKPRGPSGALGGGALNFLLANSDRYNYLPLPTPGPQAMMRAPSSKTSAPKPIRAPNASDPRNIEIEAIHNILKAKANGEEAIKAARSGGSLDNVPKVAGPAVVGSPKLKNGLPESDPHQQEIDAIMAARQQAIDGIDAARKKHTKRLHTGAAGLPPKAVSYVNIVQQDGAEVLSRFPQLRSALALYAGADLSLGGSSSGTSGSEPAFSSLSTMRFLASNGSKTEARLPQLRSALALYADTLSAEIESEEQSKELAAALALRTQKQYDSSFGAARQDGVTRRRFLGGFESPDWPKPPSCAWLPGLRQAPDVRVQERGDRLTKYVNPGLRLEVRPILKVGSMMILPLLQCLQETANNLTKLPPRAKRSTWKEVAQRTVTPDDYRAHTLVRSPLSRFASTFSEVLRRTFLYECPLGPCEAERDFFTEQSLATVKKQDWYPHAERFCAVPLKQTLRRKRALRAAIGAFTGTTSCNLQYYGAEHTMTQTMQLVAQGGGPIKPWAGEVAIHHLEEIATPSLAKTSTFLKAMGLDGLNESVIAGCFASNQFMTHGSRPAGDRRVPIPFEKLKGPRAGPKGTQSFLQGSVNFLQMDASGRGKEPEAGGKGGAGGKKAGGGSDIDKPEGDSKDKKPYGAGNEGGKDSGVGKAPGCELPESNELMAMIEDDPALLLPLTATYAQDMLCLGYPPPAGVLKLIGDIKMVRGGFARRFVESKANATGNATGNRTLEPAPSGGVEYALPASMPNLTVSPAGRYQLAPNMAKATGAKANATQTIKSHQPRVTRGDGLGTPASALANTSLPGGGSVAPVVRTMGDQL